MGMGIREYARHAGISHTSVRKALASGRISQDADGTIDPDKADIAYASNTNPGQRNTARPPPQAATVNQPVNQPSPQRSPVPAIKPTTNRVADNTVDQSTSGVPNYHMSRAIREAYNAKTARISYEKLAGTVLNAADVDRDAYAIGRRIRDKLEGIPGRLSAILAEETAARNIERIIAKSIRECLEELYSDG